VDTAPTAPLYGRAAAVASLQRVLRLAWPRWGVAALGVLASLAFIAGGLWVGALALRALTLRQGQAGGLAHSVGRVLNAVAAIGEQAAATGRPSLLLAALPDWQGTEPFSVLLLGIDQRDDERESGSDPGRTDTMMLLWVDPQAKAAGLIGIPRDLWVDIPGFGKGRVNSAYTYGELYKARVEGGGPALAKRTVEANLGLRVDYYALVNLHGFEQLIDTLGGVVIDVDRPIKDDEYPFGDYGIQRLYIPVGLQFMNGALALQYARSRHSENDFGRMRRQQKVLFAARQRALQLNMLPRAPALLGQLRDLVSTDLSLDQLLRLAKLGQQIDVDRIQHLVIGPPLVWEANPAAGEYELLWDRPRVQQALHEFVAGLNPARAGARIVVLNGSSRAGLATATAEYLSHLGYEVVRVADAERGDYDQSVIEAVPERSGLAEDLAATLHLSRWTPSPPRAGDAEAEVRIILGRDFKLPVSTGGPSPAAEEQLAPPLPPRPN
jgi:LCP family protein required for cell wall assembly